MHRGRILVGSLLACAMVTAGATSAQAQGRGFGPPTKAPSKLRSVPAETTAAKVTDPNWKAPRTQWGAPDLTGIWTSDDMRGVPATRPANQKDRESLTPEEFQRRAGGDEASRDRAVNQETVLRNEFGVRTFGYTSFVIDPPDGQLPALTPAGQAKQRVSFGVGTFGGGPFNDFSNFTLYDRCITRGIAGIFPVLYGNGLRIMQTPDEVIISYEMIHDTRVVYLDGRPHVGSSIRQYMGNSVGHWEGDTLVVSTTSVSRRRVQRPEQREAEGDGAVHADRSADDRLPHPHRGSGDVHCTVHDPLHDHAAAELPALRVLLPRRQRRRWQRPERRARLRQGRGRGDRQGTTDSHARADGHGSVHGRSCGRPGGGS